MDKRFMVILTILLVGFVGFLVYNAREKPSQQSGASSQGSSNVYGNVDSKVTLTEFVDFQCEACYGYYPYVKQLKEKYKDTVKFEVKYFPITQSHQFAMQAARSAEAAARQGKFWEMHDKIFEGQKMWEQSKDPSVFFDKYAQEIGLDVGKYEVDFASADVSSVINADLRAVQAIGGTGTPTFVLNGQKIESPGASLEALSKVLDDALAEAKSKEQ